MIKGFFGLKEKLYLVIKEAIKMEKYSTKKGYNKVTNQRTYVIQYKTLFAKLFNCLAVLL